ncbi:MAG: KEOPS complex N(6)-L-threonylcarbamoyladenine synthase Kae1 [Candidatus Woesearchaeota archaeon]
MICLGIESTAHTFGVGIVTNEGKILANEKDSYTTTHGGIHPSAAKEHHLKVADQVINSALAKAGLQEHQIGLVSFSQGPGLAPCLVVGLEKATDFCRRNKISLVGVNHCISHLEIGRLVTPAKDPVLLYVSGANTQVIAYEGGKYRIFGETLDNGVGNFLDAFGRELGIGFPGGPKIAELASKGKQYIELPYVVKGMDISVGGILTNLKQKIGKFSNEDLAYSAQETVFAMLVEVAERAMAHCEKKELLLGGGVACNKRLQEMCRKMCLERGAKCFVPENQFLVDNGVQIAWQGILQQKEATGNKLDIKPYQRTDDVEVNWR